MTLRKPAARPDRKHYRPRLEPLENRRVLATIIVTSANDNLSVDGQVTLREAIFAAEANVSIDGSAAGEQGQDTIRFASSLSGIPIRMAGSEYLISESLIIEGNGAHETIISGENLSRIFSFFGSVTGGENHYELSGLKLQNGKAVKVSASDPDEIGGAIVFEGTREESLVVRDSVIENSQADVGGGIHVDGVKLHIDGSTITFNQASFGGGLSAQNVRAVITNSTIHSNSAATRGGGIHHLGFDPVQPSTLDLINVTVTDNAARNIHNASRDDGDAVVQYGNSIIAGGSAPGFGNEVVTGSGIATATSLGNNLLDFPPVGLTNDADRILLGAGEIGLGVLFSNGGDVPTQAIHPLSFAVDGGNNQLAVGPGPDLIWGNGDDLPLETDQRSTGFIRILNGGSGTAAVDIGAFEVQSTLTAPSPLLVSDAGDTSFFGSTSIDTNDLTLREAIQIANLRNGPDTITFSSLLDNQTIALDGNSIRAVDSVEILGPGADRLTISGSQESGIFSFGDEGDDGGKFIVAGLTLTAGSATSGGAIFSQSSELVIRDTVFDGNNASFGGGLLSLGTDVHLLNSSFVGNRATGNGGGAHISDSRGSIINVTFSGNIAEDIGGGGLWAGAGDQEGVSDISIINSTFVDNSANEGSNIYVTAVASAATSNLGIGNSIFVSEGESAGSSVVSGGSPIATITSLGNNIASQQFISNPHPSDLANTDPLLGALETVLSGIPTYTPAIESPASDGGNDQLLPADTFDIDGDGDSAESFPLDANGNPRAVNLPSLENEPLVDVGAVEIQSDPNAVFFDYGDAPDPEYPTLRQNNAPSHVIDDLFLGTSVDEEFNGQPTDNADGDGSDDDGISFLTSLVTHPTVPTTATLSVTASQAGLLDGWIDFNGDGDWLDDGEQVFASQSVVAGSQAIAVSIPAASQVGLTFARFRISAVGGLQSDTGVVTGGEVEDYAVNIVDGSEGVAVNLIVDATHSFITSSSNLVVAAGTEIIFQTPAALISSLTFIGTEGNDLIRLADFSGQQGDQIPITIDGKGGSDSVKLAKIFDYDNASRITFEAVENLQPGSDFEPDTTLTPLLVAAAKGNVELVTIVVDNTDPIVADDGWQYSRSASTSDGFSRILAAGTTEVAIIGGGDWTNPIEKHDVDTKNGVTALDALIILNHLATRQFIVEGSSELVDAASVSEFPNFFYDTTGGGDATALDALRVINFIAQQNLSGESENVEAGLFPQPVLPALAPLDLGSRIACQEVTARLEGSERSGLLKMSPRWVPLRSGRSAAERIEPVEFEAREQAENVDAALLQLNEILFS